jgi:hypothetical protein
MQVFSLEGAVMPELPVQNVKQSFHAGSKAKCKTIPPGSKHVHIDLALGEEFIQAYFSLS